jgi:hypothetical protein
MSEQGKPQPWLEQKVQLYAALLIGLGVVLFAGSALVGAASLMEGVTHLFGEGQVAIPETPEQCRQRLTFLAGLVGAAAVGWTLARLGDCHRQPGQQGPGAVRLVAELLLLLGGIGLAVGLLVAWGHQVAAYPVDEEYRQVGNWAAVSGPVLLVLGWVLLRCARKKGPPHEPSTGDGEGPVV